MAARCEFSRQLRDNSYSSRRGYYRDLDSTSYPELAFEHVTSSHLSLYSEELPHDCFEVERVIARRQLRGRSTVRQYKPSFKCSILIVKYTL